MLDLLTANLQSKMINSSVSFLVKYYCFQLKYSLLSIQNQKVDRHLRQAVFIAVIRFYDKIF